MKTSVCRRQTVMVVDIQADAGGQTFGQISETASLQNDPDQAF
jgi:hypothetical protein